MCRSAPWVRSGAKEKARRKPGFSFVLRLRLFGGGHFFGFAFLAHHFELALGFFPGGLDFLLDFGCRFLELRREFDVAVVFHARTGGDEAADDRSSAASSPPVRAWNTTATSNSLRSSRKRQPKSSRKSRPPGKKPSASSK